MADLGNQQFEVFEATSLTGSPNSSYDEEDPNVVFTSENIYLHDVNWVSSIHQVPSPNNVNVIRGDHEVGNGMKILFFSEPFFRSSDITSFETVSGVIRDREGLPVVRRVYAFERTKMQPFGEQMSGVDGSYSFNLPSGMEFLILTLDDNQYPKMNAVVLDKVKT